MTARSKIPAILTSHHYPDDPTDMRDRLFRVRSREPLPTGRFGDTVIADIYGDDPCTCLAELVDSYRKRTNMSGGDISLLIDREFFAKHHDKHTFNLLSYALIDAHQQLSLDASMARSARLGPCPSVGEQL